MYKAKTEQFKNIKQREIAEKVGITEFTMSRIINQKQNTSKTTAYCIVKTIDKNAEIEDYFDYIKKGE
jgi:plasmid maintenance system antidote protein VapI